MSIAAAILTIILKATAFYITGSVGLLSDAVESLVNLVAAVIALSMLKVAARPPDENHAYGHSKAEYFSSVTEGIFIIIAATSIGLAAIQRLSTPMGIEQPFWGLLLSIVASGINLFVALQLLRAGKKYRSITLEADAHHLLTDVWTSVGVIAAVAAVAISGWQWLDPLIALAVAVNIVFTGITLIKRSAFGFMDTTLPETEIAEIKKILDTFHTNGITYHSLRTRQSASRSFMSVHILVPDEWTVKHGHQILEQIEGKFAEVMPHLTVFTHLEPLKDPSSFNDVSMA
jgi:cation diffusion facilitator family transporter